MPDQSSLFSGGHEISHDNDLMCRPAVACTCRRTVCFLLALFWLTVQSGCAQLPHSPRAGMAWDVEKQHMLPVSDVLQQASLADIVLLGETHDNSDHHVIEAAFLDALAAKRPTVLVLEQYDLEQQPTLDAIARSGDQNEARLGTLERLMGAGWEWRGYQPLLATAMRRGLPVVAANASRATLRKVSKEGFAALGPNRSAHLGLDSHWGAAQQAILASDIADGHCGTLPAEAVTAIALAQRARDALMADRILAQSSTLVVAILGREHVRDDLAVPVYLRQRAGNRRFISVGMVEVDDRTAAADYDSSGLGALYDYILFTKPVTRKTDPCAAFAPGARQRP